MSAAIKACTCVNSYQDKKYGTNKRVHTVMVNEKFKCTVCGDVKLPGPVGKKKK